MGEKKAVITLLGMISHTKLEYLCKDGEIEKQFIDIPEDDRAIYRFSKELNQFSSLLTKKHYINTLPLLIDVFRDRDIIPIATQRSKNIQEKTLEFLKLDISSIDKTIIINESNYEEIFQQISECLQKDKYESFIIDLTHGFRHLPILMIINLIIASIKDIDKIEHIFFAKEITSQKEYEIIDLLDYIGLAKLSFVLENFNTNYTVGNKLIFKNEGYQDLVDSLRIISSHILANSIKTLIEGEKSLIQNTIEKLTILQKEDKNIATFSTSIDNIIKHLNKIQILKTEENYIKLFKFAEMMKEREYLLNSITLLNESIGLYCAKKIGDISEQIQKHIDTYLADNSYNLYELAHQSKNIIKNLDSFTGDYLFEANRIKLSAGQRTSLQKKKKRLKEKIDTKVREEIKHEGFKIELSSIDVAKDKTIKHQIIDYLKDENNFELIDLIRKIGDLRNNLAHGNSSEEVENVKGTISFLLKEYQRIAKIPKEIDIKEKVHQIEKEKAPKKKKQKIIPKGIDAPKEKIDDLTNLFNNR